MVQQPDYPLTHLADTKHNTLIIVPTYNERDNLPDVVKKLGELSVDMLVVDDNSPDGTGEMADEFAQQDDCVHVLHRKEKSGLGRAYCAGFEWALKHDYEFIFEMDGDFSHALSRGHSCNQLAAASANTKSECGQICEMDYRHALHRSNWRLQMFPPARPGKRRPRSRSVQWL